LQSLRNPIDWHRLAYGPALKKPRLVLLVPGVDGEAMTQAATIASLGLLYERRYSRFLRVAEAIVGDPESAHDVVQDAFAQAIRSRFGFRGEGDLEAWVWRIVVNAAHRARRPPRPSLDEVAVNAAAANGRPGVDDEVRALVAALPERQRSVLFLRYYAEQDYQQIADALDIQPGTVGATLHQAHAALRRVLEGVSR
jgi:RNA polymerase sigma factor (sigma-70 family)